MISDDTRSRWDSRIALCVKYYEKLNDWEMGFIDSVQVWRAQGTDLSFKQSSKLADIFHALEDRL
jgi:hypothetical protein